MKLIWLSCLLGVVPHVAHSQGIVTLEQARLLAQELPEYPDIDNYDLKFPRYTSLYKKRIPSLYTSIKKMFGLGKSLWSSSDFFSIVQDIAQERENYGYWGRFYEKIVPRADQRVYIITSLHGAYHSLLRILTELENSGVITNEYELVDNCVLIFNGNVIDYGPYPMETLMVVCQILKKNPRSAIYIRGLHEDRQYWYDYNFFEQLEIMGTDGLDREQILMIFNRFFNTLPLRYYMLNYQNDQAQAVFITSLPFDDKEDTDDFLGNFFSHDDTTYPFIYRLEKRMPTQPQAQIRAILEADTHKVTLEVVNGLYKSYFANNRIVWELLSSPIRIHRTLYEFFYDAFVQIGVTENMSDWTISLYNHDIREPGFITKDKEYDLLTGAEIIDGKKVVVPSEGAERVLPKEVTTESQVPATGEEFLIGSTINLTGPGPKQLRQGIDLAFQEANEKGGLFGKKLRFVPLDDGYEAERALKNVEKLLHDYAVDIILCPYGYDSVEAFMQLIKDKKVAVFFPNSGADELHDPELVNLINFRVPYSDMDIGMIKYAETVLKPARMAFVYPEGEEAFGVDQHIKDAKIAVEYKEFRHKESETDFSKILNDLKEFKPDVIGLFSTAIEEFIRQADVEFLISRTLLMTDIDDNFRQVMQTKGLSERLIVPQILPNPETSTLQIAQDFRRLMGDKKLEFFTFEGYVEGRLLIEIMRTVEQPLTKEKILQKFESLTNYDFGGLKLDFIQSRRDLCHTLWLEQGKPEWKPINLLELVGYKEQKSE